MSNNDLFLDLYNKLDSLLRTYYNDEKLDNSMINRRINELKRSNRNEKKLRGIKLHDARNVRNLLAHTMKNNGNDLFDVNNDLIEFLDKTMPEMVYIKSLIDDKEYQIYEDDLVNYTIDNFKNMIYIQLKNNKNKISIAF